MMQDDIKMYRRLRGTVRMLASDASHQADYLAKASQQAKYPILVHDITTEFGAWYQYARQLADRGLLNQLSLERLNSLSTLINAIPSDAEHWTAEALATSTAWAEMRQVAVTALTAMDTHFPIEGRQ